MEKQSQHTRILRMLKKAYVNGVPNYKFTDAGILDYTARISELRKDGHIIAASRVWRDGKATGTFRYFLREDDVQVEEVRPRGFRKFLGFKV